MKLRTVTAILVGCLSIVAQDSEKPPNRVITWNILNGFGNGKKVDEAVEWLRDQDADVVALQELTGINGKKLSAIAKRYHHPYSAISKERGYPVGLTSKVPIHVIERRTVGMHHGYLHARAGGMDFIVVHLHPGDWQFRVREAKVLVQTIGAVLRSGRRVCVLGDFNAHSPVDCQRLAEQSPLRQRRSRGKNLREGDFDFEALETILSLDLIDLCHQRLRDRPEYRGTFPTRFLKHANTAAKQSGFFERIDFVLVDEETAKTCSSIAMPKGMVLDDISDHYPVIADFSSRGLTETLADRTSFVGIAVAEPGYHVWGCSPIVGRDGRTHLFAARWPREHRVDPGWRTHSEIAEYIAEKPEGPYTFARVVLRGTGKDTWDRFAPHNPAIHQVGDRYILLYIANDGRATHPANQRIGMMTASSLSGPWKKIGNRGLILAPSDDSKHWTHGASNGVNNPALLQHPDGRLFLYFKSQGGKMGVAIADQVEGPYVVQPLPVTSNDRAVEDGYAFVQDGCIYLVTTDNHGIRKKGGGLIWESVDGRSFAEPSVAFDTVDGYLANDRLRAARRHYGAALKKFERPQVLLQNGKPTHLFVASGTALFGGDATTSYVLRIR